VGFELSYVDDPKAHQNSLGYVLPLQELGLGPFHQLALARVVIDYRLGKQ